MAAEHQVRGLRQVLDEDVMILPSFDRDPWQVPGETRIEYPTLVVNWTQPNNMQADAFVLSLVEKRENDS